MEILNLRISYDKSNRLPASNVSKILYFNQSPVLAKFFSIGVFCGRLEGCTSPWMCRFLIPRVKTQQVEFLQSDDFLFNSLAKQYFMHMPDCWAHVFVISYFNCSWFLSSKMSSQSGNSSDELSDFSLFGFCEWTAKIMAKYANTAKTFML